MEVWSPLSRGKSTLANNFINHLILHLLTRIIKLLQ